VTLQDSTKTENTVGHVNINHQVLEEGIDNMFILVNSPFVDEQRKEGSWGLDFDGAHSSTGSDAGIVLRSLDNETTLFSYRLEFDYTNNIAEYEALILGINLAIDMNIKNLHVKGDSDLIVSQVNRKFAIKNPRLKQYRDVVWDAIERFDNFSIEAILREENHLADNLVVSVSNLQLSKEIGFWMSSEYRNYFFDYWSKCLVIVFSLLLGESFGHNLVFVHLYTVICNMIDLLYQSWSFH